MPYRINRNAHRPRKASDKAPINVRISRFLERQGFYVILLACLGIVGVTAFLTLSAPSEDAPLQQIETDVDWPNLAENQPSLDEILNVTPTPAPTLAPTPTPSPQPTPRPTATPESGSVPAVAQIDPDPDPTPEPSAAPEPTPKREASAKLAFSSPVAGTLSVKFADKNLVYNKTLKQWATHPAIDISAKEGTPVRAVLGGKVEAVEKDPMLGYKIVIAHDNDRRSVYANLADDGGLKKGQAVNSGDAIGKVGTSGISEIEDGPHLHFEFHQKGKPLDPEPLIENLTKGMPESE